MRIATLPKLWESVRINLRVPCAQPQARPHGAGLWLVGLVVISASCGDAVDSTVRIEVVRDFQEPSGGFWQPVDLVSLGHDVWALDAGNAVVHRYTKGELVASIGRRGSGPGELNQPTALGVLGDTLWVLNGGNGRIEWFDTAGVHLGSRPLPPGAQGLMHMRALGTDFVATTILPHVPPLLRFPRDPAAGAPQAFGRELAQAAAEVLAEAGLPAPPAAYRLVILEGVLYALHTQLPLMGVFGSTPEPQVVRLPAAPLEGGSVSRRDDVTVFRGPDHPVGVLDLLPLGDGTLLAVGQPRVNGDGVGQPLYSINSAGQAAIRGMSTLPIMYGSQTDRSTFVMVVGDPITHETGVAELHVQ